ncbi:hypothetical protein [Streptomyces radiopugnans]|uniref:Lipoprotein n=1 Tax=Streptomyces radiopugnans TaxID=403935 RepID=A0A1H9DRH6_9ACTN|nr:hypothetical protein [Streptomyces radiopugnans]SEQ16082.1 hypothetical protein SAMN05216481_104246 [Streptomyces radiopugnans]
MFRTSRGRLRRAAITAAVAVAALTACQPEDLPADDAPSSAIPDASAVASPSASRPAVPGGERSLVDAAEAGGLRKHTGDGAVTDVPVDPGEMREGMRLVVSHFADPEGGDPILFEGVDNVPEDTSKRREHLFRGMLEYIEWDPELGQPQAQPVADPGPLGGSVECLTASLAENGQVICGWADESTAAVALFPDSTSDEAGKLFVAMRGDLER